MDRAGRFPWRRVFLAGAALVCAWFPRPLPAAAPPGRPAGLEAVRPVLEDALDASQLEGASRDAARERFYALAGEVWARYGRFRSAVRRGRRLHAFLHARVFRVYREDADGLDAVLERGEFNCVSATLLEGVLARVVGLEPTVVPGAHHVFLRLEVPGRTIDVEPTAPDGFDVHGDDLRVAAFLLAYKLASPDEIAARGARVLLDAHEGFSDPVALSEAPAFVWYNAAERALAREEGRKAAEILFEGNLRHPGVAARPEVLEAVFSRAFRQDYDAHRFEDAYATAVLGVTLAPANASAQNRLIAAGAELVEAAADSGDAAAGERLVADVVARAGGAARRFERSVLPALIAAAVRREDWERADCLAGAYTSVEPDRVEAARVASWVGARRMLAAAPSGVAGP